MDTDKKFKKRPESITATIYNGKRKVCEVSRFCGACSSTLGVVPSTYGAQQSPRLFEIWKLTKTAKFAFALVLSHALLVLALSHKTGV